MQIRVATLRFILLLLFDSLPYPCLHECELSGQSIVLHCPSRNEKFCWRASRQEVKKRSVLTAHDIFTCKQRSHQAKGPFIIYGWTLSILLVHAALPVQH